MEALEAEIDALVYKLYGLTEAEIKIVEGWQERDCGIDYKKKARPKLRLAFIFGFIPFRVRRLSESD